MGFISTKVYPNSFPGIVEALRARGATVYITNVESLGATREKAEQFKTGFLQIKATDGSAKFNIMGHSHGGLYTRDAITNLGLAPNVASLTTVDSPHRGSVLAGVMNLINNVAPMIGNLIAGFIPFPGDQSKLAINIQQLTPNYMNNTFNPNCPNAAGVYYQSWTGQYKVYNLFSTTAHFLIMLVQALTGTSSTPSTPQEYVAAFNKVLPDLATEIFFLGGGFNDGLVPVNSAKWGTFLGVQSGNWFTKGVNHIDVVNLSPNGAPFDVVGYWVKVVQNLKNKGY